jgi:hypothetical protein
MAESGIRGRIMHTARRKESIRFFMVRPFPYNKVGRKIYKIIIS